MFILKRLILLLVIAPITTHSFALSLAELHHQMRVVTSEVMVLKKQKAATVQTRTFGVQVGKTKLHAYIKGIELLEKINRYQLQNNLPPLVIPDLPLKRVKSKNILEIVKLAATQMREINASAKLIAEPIKADTSSKTASDLYGEILQASYLMDSLLEPTSLAQIMRNNNKIESGLANIAKRLNKPINSVQLSTFTDKKAEDVTLGLYKLLYKLAHLERKLKIKPLVVPNFPTGTIYPEDANDTAGSVIADLTRIAHKLKIAPIKKEDESSIAQNVDVNSVYAQVVRMNSSAQLLFK
ncbi:MAG: hypothetical protein ACI9ES_000036 [Oceanospirillaceae bacterium]|jgi:hypothetical protein